MKPIAVNDDKRAGRQFPLTTFAFHAGDFDGLRCSGRPYPSFADIGRDYFARESARAGRIETLIFGIVASTAIPALIDGARAASHLLSLIS